MHRYEAMFKRFLVTDLFHSKEKYGGGGWKNAIKDLPKDPNGIFNVKLLDGTIRLAYFYSDKIINLMKNSANESSYWWDKKEKIPLHNVIEWEENLDENSKIRNT